MNIFPEKDEDTKVTYFLFTKVYFKTLVQDFVSVYSSLFLLKWSIWWALATCGYYQIGNYIQTLWETMQTNEQNIYNGVTEAVNTFLGTVTILCMQFVRVQWEKWGEIALAVTCGLDCLLLVLMSQIPNLVVSYVLYVIFRVLYQMMITIAQYNLARKLETQSFGLVFGFNTFMALVLQTVLTVTVADHHGLHLEIHTQFVIYGIYHGIIGAVFLIMGFFTLKKFSRVEDVVPVPPSVILTQPSQFGTNVVVEPEIDYDPTKRHRKKRKHRKHNRDDPENKIHKESVQNP